MSNKKLFVIILSAVVLSSVVSLGAYKIFTKNTAPPSLTNNPNFETIVDSIDYSENLLDSNTVYKERFNSDLQSQGKWIPVKSTDLIKELTTDHSKDSPEIQKVSNETLPEENSTLARNIAPVDNDDTFEEEVQTTNITSSNNNASVREVSENKTKTEVKIVYLWQPNDCNESSWNPYSNGHWEFTCAGWVWASDYRWGSHCYNYGRWMWTSFAGWVWMPGDRWAPNWVTWRYCGNYNGGSYCGWYPQAPVLYWQNYQSHLVVCNSHFNSNPIHWTVVNTNNFTKTITKTTKVNNEINSQILNNSSKVKTVNTLVTSEQQIKYSGPNVNEISKVTKSTITPKYIEVPTKTDLTSSGTKQTVVSDPVVKIKQTKKTDGVDPVKLNEQITKSNVSNPITNETNPIKIKQPNNINTTSETNPVKTAGPSVNNTTKNTNVKEEQPAKSTSTTKTSTTKTETPKQETPTKQTPTKQTTPPKQDPPTKQNTPTKQDPPKYDPPVKQDPPPTRQDPPPVKQDPPPVKQDPPKQDPPKQDSPKQDPPKKDDGKKSD